MSFGAQISTLHMTATTTIVILKLSLIEDRGQTDRITETLTLTYYNLDFQFRQAMIMTHTQAKIKVKGQSVQKIE